MQFEAGTLKILHRIGLAISGRKLVERLAKRIAELLEVAVPVPESEDGSGEGVARFGKVGIGLSNIAWPTNACERRVRRRKRLPCEIESAHALYYRGAEQAEQKVVRRLVLRMSLEA